MSQNPPPMQGPAPLRTLFLLTSMPVGGAETLLLDLIRRMDRERFDPEVACLKNLDELGQAISGEVRITSNYLSHKYDLRVLPRLVRYLRREKIDALVTVGAGDKMFWGRLAACLAGTPVVISALHSTGWPDGVGRLNRMLTPWTDAFVGVADEHGRYLREEGGFPADRVHVIPNGVDTDRFCHDIAAGSEIRQELGIPLDVPACGIVAALRPEKNHELFLATAHKVRQTYPDTHFLIVGDGPERTRLQRMTHALRLDDQVHFLGTRRDVPAILAAMNCLLLTSKMEANPVSILEALSTETPVVATDVGSVSTTVIDGKTGFLAAPGSVDDLTEKACKLIGDMSLAARLGRQGRQLVSAQYSVDGMVTGYQDLIAKIYAAKTKRAVTRNGPVNQPQEERADGEPRKPARVPI